MLGEKPKADLTVGVVVPVHNCLKYTLQTINSFRSSFRFQWIVLDNESDDGTQEFFRSEPEFNEAALTNCLGVSYRRFEENLGVARSWNLGIQTAFEEGCDLAFVVNNDLIFASDTFDNLMSWYSGGHLLSVTNVGNRPQLLNSYRRRRVALPRANFIGFLIDSNITRRVGWFDEGYVQGYYEDDDYVKRCQDEGVLTLSCMDAPVVHLGSRTTKEGRVNNEPTFTQNRQRFLEKWGYLPDHTPSRKPRLLWVGDAVRQTGFWRVGENVLSRLDRDWDIHVLGVNHTGDPHRHPWPIYPAATGGDAWGVNRYDKVVRHVRPDVIVAINDPFIVVDYLEVNRAVGGRLVGYMPVDSLNIRHDWCEALNGLTAGVFYTKFGQVEAQRHGFDRPCYIVPHGVDLSTYQPRSRQECRQVLGIGELDEWFIFGNVNNNQPRKRLDLTLFYFSRWLKVYGHEDDKVALYLHCKTRGIGWDLRQLALEYGIEDRVIMLAPELLESGAVTEARMKDVYGALDVQISTTMGEGWGLTTMEGMACGIPQIVPQWSGLQEWAEKAAYQVPCTNISAAPGNMNGIGGVADMDQFLEALEQMYSDSKTRATYSGRGKDLVAQPRFNWDEIARQWDGLLNEALELDNPHGSQG